MKKLKEIFITVLFLISYIVYETIQFLPFTSILILFGCLMWIVGLQFVGWMVWLLCILFMIVKTVADVTNKEGRF